MPDLPGHKDIVLGIMGASAGLAGFLLVFFGVILTGIVAAMGGGTRMTQASLREPPRMLERLLEPYQQSLNRLAGLAIAVTFGFIWGLGVEGSALLWLLFPGDGWLWCCTGAFALLIVGLMVLGVLVVRELLHATPTFG